MTTMIERVARALFYHDQGGRRPDDNARLWERLKKDPPASDRYRYAEYLRQARAAIAEMREPTEAVVQIGDKVRGNHMSGYGNHTAGIFTAMIDAALAEGTEAK